MVPPAPALFSTITGCPSSAEIPCATARATPSVPPPGGNGTINLIGWVGHDCAPAVPAAQASARARAETTRRRWLMALLLVPCDGGAQGGAPLGLHFHDGACLGEDGRLLDAPGPGRRSRRDDVTRIQRDA